MVEERGISEFNGSQLKIFRIDEIIRGINQCRHNLDLYQWLFYLQDFDMELESVKKTNEKETLHTELQQLSDKINTQLRINNSKGMRGKKQIPPQIIDSLNTYQKKLLEIFKSSGLEMKIQGNALSKFGR